MALSRRGFLGVVGAARAPISGTALAAPLPAGVEEIRINSNENPMGPGQAAIDAILAHFPQAGRYPFNGVPDDLALAARLASKHEVKPENVVLGAGSQEVLRNAVRAFTSPARHLVTGAPTFENCTSLARRLGHPVTEIKVDGAFRLDLGAMLAVARGAGLVYLCNPNNPTATMHDARAITDFVERLRRISPDTAVLIDEAYHDYVTDSGYATAIPLAMSTPNVFVARTFSKAYGMAGMRIGYAIGSADTIRPLARLQMPYNVSVFGIAAAIAALDDPAHIDRERARNTEARAFMVKALADLDCKPTASETNFIFVNVGRPARQFRDACARAGVMVGRDFPPFEGSHVRISIGTMSEMRRAAGVVRDVLRPAAGGMRQEESC